MSMPTIPDLNPEINLEIEDSIKMLCNSIALNEIGLSHITNAQGEAIQSILAELKECTNKCGCSNEVIDKILQANDSTNKFLNNLLQNQMMLKMQIENTMSLYDKVILAKSDENVENFVYCSNNNTYSYEEETDVINMEYDQGGISCEVIDFIEMEQSNI